MRIEITKGQREDITSVTRGDGSSVQFTFPKKGTLPHDAVHFFVERGLGMQSAFWGKVASGVDPKDVAAMAAAGGHASATRAQTPDPAVVELIQAERLVECFEAEFWSEGSDDEALFEIACAGWTASHVPVVAGAEQAIPSIRCDIHSFAKDWKALKLGGSLMLNWELDR